MVFGCLSSHCGVCSGAEAMGKVTTDVQLRLCIGHQQSLCVSVHSNELNAFQANFNHSIDGVNTAATNSDDFDNRQMILRCDHNLALFLRTNLKPQVEG